MKKKTHESYSFRLPIDLLKWLRETANKSCRPLASQLEYILRRAREEQLDSK